MKYQNPSNVPTGGRQTYAAIEPITHAQLRMLGWLKRTCGSPDTWEQDCRKVLGQDWDGKFESLSKAAGSWLIYVLQAGLVAVTDRGDELRSVPE